MSVTGVGIVGFGFMGRTHAAGYRAAGARARVVGVARGREGGKAGSPDPGLDDEVAWVESAEELLTRRDIDAVSICTYTDSHVPLALRALELGKHVLVEKPVALESCEVARLAAAARSSGRVCMPAMCMRFWPGWPWLRDRIRDRAFGAVRRAAFTRLGSRPGWGTEFYSDERRSGGALFDLHIHDVDFARWCFGDPESVESTGSSHDVSTKYHYPGSGVQVTARGAWLADPSAKFTMQYEVEFTDAIARFDLARPGSVFLERGGADEVVPLPDTGAYDAEIAHFLDLVQGRTATARATIEDAVQVTRILEAEAESLRSGVAVAPDRAGR